jgi:hypothetical protein
MIFSFILPGVISEGDYWAWLNYPEIPDSSTCKGWLQVRQSSQ